MNGNRIKILKIGSLYSDYLRYFYFAQTSFQNRDYQSQLEALMDDGFGWGGSWKKYLEATGNFEVNEVIINAYLLQTQWAKEHSVNVDKKNYLLGILEAQIAEYKPGILFINDNSFFAKGFGMLMKKKFSNIKFVIGWDGIAQNDVERFKGCDLMLSPLQNVVEFYRKSGFDSYFFPLGFEPGILDKLKPSDLKYDLSFVGSVFIGKDLHTKRFDLLSQIADVLPLSIWSSSLPNGFLLNLEQLKRLLKFRLREFCKVQKLAKVNHGPAFGLGMYQILKESKITFNSHIDSAGKQGGNLRLFEATGVGACLVTDWKENIGDFFVPDVEVVVYRTANEAIDKIRYLLSHEEERKKIALAGQKRTLSYHSIEKSINEFAGYLINNYVNNEN
jgi:hypothetical protein